MFELIRAHQLNIMLVLCGVCASMTLLLLITRFMSKRRKKILILMEMIAILLLWFDRQAYLYAGVSGMTGYVMVRVSNFFVFFMTSAIVLGFNLYLTDRLLTEGGMEKPLMRLRIVQVMAIAGMMLAVISAFTNLYYYFDENNTYHRGQGFLIAYIIPIVCPIIQYTVIQQYHKKFSKLIFISLILYIFVPILCGIIQIFTYGISIVNMAMVMVSISLYIFTYLDINNEVVRAHQLEVDSLHESQKSMKRLFDQTATAFVTAVEKKDDFLEGHSVKVAEYARMIAALSGSDEEECDKVYYSALLHDVGLIGIPDKVIKNEEDPDKWDYEVMRRKPLIGREILSSITEYPYLSIGAYYSHERYNGTGYPEGVKGEDIPELARIIAVADAYVSMTTKKRYREARPGFIVREAFVKGAGEEFDPKYAGYMVEIMDTEGRKAMQEEALVVDPELICGEYRDAVSNGIQVEDTYIKIFFDCSATEVPTGGFSAPSIILYDAFDSHIHNNNKAIKEYHYVEFGEVWFDSHSIVTAARDIKESEIVDSNGTNGVGYEIIAGRYEDHVKLIMKSPDHEKEVILAMPDSSESIYIGLTGEHCNLSNIHIEQTEEKLDANTIPKIATEISYINRMESDLKNVQINRTRSAATAGVEIKDRLKLHFHTMSLPGSTLIWHCPYVVLFTSEDGCVGGKNYREYALIKLNGECEESGETEHNHFSMKKVDAFQGWEAWKAANQAGLECEVAFIKKGSHVITTTENLGIEIKNITEIDDDSVPVYVALTGDQCALTDIRVK